VSGAEATSHGAFPAVTPGAHVDPEPITTTPVVQTHRLSHRFGRTWALKDVDLEIDEGSLYALLGPNGAGKTTLLKILMGLLHPTSGEAQLRGRPIGSLSTRERARIAYVAEGQELPGWMTLRQLTAYLAPMYERWDAGLARHLEGRFRLPTDRRIHRLSRGEQMKTALLAALAARPEILIMDEPFTGMDALVKDEIVYGLLELAQSGDWTVLLCSHDIGELENLADWIGFLDRGRLILSEPLEVLRGRFRRVEVTLGSGALAEMNGMPPTWLSPQRAGNRVSFVTCDHGVAGWEDDVRVNLPGAGRVEVCGASLREVFVALAAEGMGGRDWESKGGLR
jgi:ABC-2 type transport system ATP-binding protein